MWDTLTLRNVERVKIEQTNGGYRQKPLLKYSLRLSLGLQPNNTIRWGDLFVDCETEREVIDLLKNKLSYYNEERIHSSLGYLTPDEFVAGELKIAAHA